MVNCGEYWRILSSEESMVYIWFPKFNRVLYVTRVICVRRELIHDYYWNRIEKRQSERNMWSNEIVSIDLLCLYVDIWHLSNEVMHDRLWILVCDIYLAILEIISNKVANTKDTFVNCNKWRTDSAECVYLYSVTECT